MKKIKKYAIWLPIVGLIIMLVETRYGKYRTYYFAGLLWWPWMFLSNTILGVYLLFLLTTP